MEPNSFEENTANHYKNDNKARSYFDAYTQSTGLDRVRFGFISTKERRCVTRLLRIAGASAAQKVTDIPTGTGKMAPVFRELALEVLACDISPNMLEIAEKSFRNESHQAVSFSEIDLRSAEHIHGSRDYCVCWRLMHRVPNEMKEALLAQIAEIAPKAIISFSIDSRYSAVRFWVRRVLFGGNKRLIGTRVNRSEIHDIVSKYFEIIQVIPVATALSAQRGYLLKSKSMRFA